MKPLARPRQLRGEEDGHEQDEQDWRTMDKASTAKTVKIAKSNPDSRQRPVDDRLL